MRALITGGVGFIGSHIVNRYVEKGWKVFILDSFEETADRNRISNLNDVEINVDRMENTLVSKVDTEPMMPIRFWGNKNEQVEFIVREILTLVENGHKYRGCSTSRFI